jgi:uncharacterized membrane protein YbaN (DUF454 family)
VGLAALGVVLPVLPTTPFLLVAAGCFAKSSPYLHGKLLQSKLFGALIRDWQEHRTIPKKSKRIALLSMFLAGCWSCYMLNSLALKILVILLMLGPAIFVYRLPISKID